MVRIEPPIARSIRAVDVVRRAQLGGVAIARPVRPYKPAFPIDDAIAEITRGAGGQFDPKLVTAFEAALLPQIRKLKEEYSDEAQRLRPVRHDYVSHQQTRRSRLGQSEVVVSRMEISGHTVLVTGGTSGIGLALAQRFLAAGNDVIICGRREEKLDAARAEHPSLRTRVVDLAQPAARVELAAWAVAEFPNLDVLVNNAGIQQRFHVAQSPDWDAVHAEIATNFEAHVHLAMLFVPHLREKKRPAIVNVTSGLAFVPIAAVPVYCATKAAMRSFTLSLRRQLADTPIEVVEIIPPAVDTDLGGPGLHTFGVPLDEFADAVFAQLLAGKTEATYGFSDEASRATSEQRDALFERMNSR